MYVIKESPYKCHHFIAKISISLNIKDTTFEPGAI